MQVSLNGLEEKGGKIKRIKKRKRNGDSWANFKARKMMRRLKRKIK